MSCHADDKPMPQKMTKITKRCMMSLGHNELMQGYSYSMAGPSFVTFFKNNGWVRFVTFFRKKKLDCILEKLFDRSSLLCK